MREVSTSFRDRLAAVDDRIASACRRANRSRASVRLMAVSKTHPAEAICEAIEAGLTLFGENRVQEFESKRMGLPESIEIHLIGHLQSNKAARAAAIFTAIDSVDSLRLLERLNDAAATAGRQLPVLLEIKLSGEEAKTGFDRSSPEFEQTLERAPDLPNIRVDGLMTIPPLDDNPDSARTCFRQLRELRDKISRQHQRLDLGELSMGMSGDFEVGIEEGSTLVRVGTALFGARDYPDPN